MSSTTTNGNLEQLLDYLRLTRGFDFGAYKRTTLGRRIMKRVEFLGLNNYEEYQDYLEVHPDEFSELFNTVLINVTSFFRDEDSWDYMASDVVPRILEAKGPEANLRAWVAGCASGEEAYTLAIVLAEHLGAASFRERVKIYATDLDEDALNHSRLASYADHQIENMPAELRTKYFERQQGKYVFDRDLRRSIIFGQHDLISDAPISRVDLLLCRNTLMYFNAETQERIISRFHFALNDGGFLFLGKAETLLTHTQAFLPVDLKRRVFTKVARGRLRDRVSMLTPLTGSPASKSEASPQLRELAFESAPVAQIVVSNAGHLIAANERARTSFGISARDIGRLFQDLEISYRPLELRSGIQQTYESRRSVGFKEVRWNPSSSESRVLDVRITPLNGAAGEIMGVTITFEDISQFKRLQDDLLNFNQELETAYEEVQSTNEELQTTNEELQSTIEELETTNEELQSTNEELETMNEELQSANEELETINEELRLRGDQLNEANAFQQSVLGSLTQGVIVVDSEMHVLAWNYKSEDLWGMRQDEVLRKHLLNLDIGLPVEQLRPVVKTCMTSATPQTIDVDCLTRKGRAIRCRVSCTPLLGVEPDPRGAILMVSELPAGS